MKKAFTLAEVLIALVIIGVIAAITIPTIVADSQKQEKISRLKKVQTTLGGLILRSNVDNGPMNTWPMGGEIGDVREDYWNVYFRPYFSDVRLCSNSFDCGYKYDLSFSKWQDVSWQVITGTTRLLFILSDGTVIFYPISTTDKNGNPSYVEKVYVDINGPKEPNTYCKDVFPFKRDYQKNSIVPMDCTAKFLIENWILIVF